MTTETPRNQGRSRACPSGVCHEDSSIIGVMTEQGRLAYLPMPVMMDTAFASRLQDAGHPERRFRFSQPCIESACSQWTGEGCGVIDHVLDDDTGSACTEHHRTEHHRTEHHRTEHHRTEHHRTAPHPGTGVLPTCAIRRDCRWFFQRGTAACGTCPTIVADTGGTATYRRPGASPPPTGAGDDSVE